MQEMIGNYVLDPSGVEIGEIVGLKDGFFEMSEGLFGSFLLDVSLVVVVDGKATLDASIHTLLKDVMVLDKEGVDIGEVYDVMEAECVIDFFLVKAEDKLYSIPIENIAKIGEIIELNIDLEEVKYIQEEHTFREEILHKFKEFLEG